MVAAEYNQFLLSVADAILTIAWLCRVATRRRFEFKAELFSAPVDDGFCKSIHGLSSENSFFARIKVGQGSLSNPPVALLDCDFYTLRESSLASLRRNPWV